MSRFAVIKNTYNSGYLGLYSGPSSGFFEHKVVKICASEEEADKYCEDNFNNVGCSTQQISEE